MHRRPTLFLLASLIVTLGLTAGWSKGRRPADENPYRSYEEQPSENVPAVAEPGTPQDVQATLQQDRPQPIEEAPMPEPALTEKAPAPAAEYQDVTVELVPPRTRAKDIAAPVKALPEPAAPVPERAAYTPPAAVKEKYKVWIWQENGDCLWRIAEKVYGDRSKWNLIYMANRDKIRDPNKIYPKQTLRIPPLDGQP